MGLNIKNAETERLVRELAGELHVSLTAAVTDAVEARLAEVRQSQPAIEQEAQRLLRIWGEFGDRLGHDYLSQDWDALLYDEKGLPR